MTNLIRVEVDASELEAKLEDLEALEAKVEELTNSVQVLEDEIDRQREEAQLPSEEEGSDMLAKFMTRDEIDEFVKEILRSSNFNRRLTGLTQGGLRPSHPYSAKTRSVSAPDRSTQALKHK